MGSSQSISLIAAALAKAQGSIGVADKNSINSHFKSDYANLTAVWGACRAPLTSNGICVTQTTDRDLDGWVLITTLLHSSGEWISSVYPLNPIKNDPQGLGSAMTYARRYSLAALVGVVQADDDGEAAVGRRPQEQDAPQRPAPPKPNATPRAMTPATHSEDTATELRTQGILAAMKINGWKREEVIGEIKAAFDAGKLANLTGGEAELPETHLRTTKPGTPLIPSRPTPSTPGVGGSFSEFKQ